MGLFKALKTAIRAKELRVGDKYKGDTVTAVDTNNGTSSVVLFETEKSDAPKLFPAETELLIERTMQVIEKDE